MPQTDYGITLNRSNIWPWRWCKPARICWWLCIAITVPSAWVGTLWPFIAVGVLALAASYLETRSEWKKRGWR